MANFPNAARHIDHLIRSVSRPYSAAGTTMPILGADLEACAEAAVASMITRFARRGAVMTPRNVRTWKIFGSRWEMHDTDVDVGVTRNGLTTEYNLKALVTLQSSGAVWRGELRERRVVGGVVFSWSGSVVTSAGRTEFRIVQAPRPPVRHAPGYEGETREV